MSPRVPRDRIGQNGCREEICGGVGCARRDADTASHAQLAPQLFGGEGQVSLAGRRVRDGRRGACVEREAGAIAPRRPDGAQLQPRGPVGRHGTSERRLEAGLEQEIRGGAPRCAGLLSSQEEVHLHGVV